MGMRNLTPPKTADRNAKMGREEWQEWQAPAERVGFPGGAVGVGMVPPVDIQLSDEIPQYVNN
jgi:hypothetical protein